MYTYGDLLQKDNKGTYVVVYINSNLYAWAQNVQFLLNVSLTLLCKCFGFLNCVFVREICMSSCKI